MLKFFRDLFCNHKETLTTFDWLQNDDVEFKAIIEYKLKTGVFYPVETFHDGNQYLGRSITTCKVCERRIKLTAYYGKVCNVPGKFNGDVPISGNDATRVDEGECKQNVCDAGGGE